MKTDTDDFVIDVYGYEKSIDKTKRKKISLKSEIKKTHKFVRSLAFDEQKKAVYDIYISYLAGLANLLQKKRKEKI